MVKHLTYSLLFSALLLLMSAHLAAQKGQVGGSASNNMSCQLHVPNAFTPNGDHINERFVVQQGENCRLLKYHMKVFDRWGRLIFETNSSDPQNAWDGTTDGKELLKGVYMYHVRATLEPLTGGSDPEVINRQGTVVLIR